MSFSNKCSLNIFANIIAESRPAEDLTCELRGLSHGHLQRRKAATLFNVRSAVFTAVTMKNGVILHIKSQFITHRKNITSPLQSPAG
jgi:hypothetical protein